MRLPWEKGDAGAQEDLDRLLNRADITTSDLDNIGVMYSGDKLNSNAVYEQLLLCRMASYGESKYQTDTKHQCYSQLLLEKCKWQPLPTSEKFGINAHGYFGTAFYRINQNKEVEIAIAHRGTCLTDKENILADIALAEGNKPKILEEAAYLYINKLQSYYQSHNIRPTKVTHTGFSLGGFIAAACCMNDESSQTYAVTFDAPGAKFLPSVTNKTDHIVNYVTVPNLVNTANRHVGDIRQIAFFEEQSSKQNDLELEFTLRFNNLGLAPPDDESRANYSSSSRKENIVAKKNIIRSFPHMRETLGSHNLDRIIGLIEHNQYQCSYRKVDKWPHATNKFIRETEDAVSCSGYLPFRNSSDSFWRSLLVFIGNSGAILGQIGWSIGQRLLWDATREWDGNRNAYVGITGVKHTRETNKILYSDTPADDRATTMQRTRSIAPSSSCTLQPNTMNAISSQYFHSVSSTGSAVEQPSIIISNPSSSTSMSTIISSMPSTFFASSSVASKEIWRSNYSQRYSETIKQEI